MKILAAITKPEAIRKILDHLGIPSEAGSRNSTVLGTDLSPSAGMLGGG
jgi:hypothetical protein